MPSSRPASLHAPRRKSFSAAIVLALITLQLLPYISGSTCCADAAPSDACPSDGISPARPTKYSSITCSTSESAFPAGEQGTLNWVGWRQINSLAACHRSCLIKDACILDGELVVFAPVDIVANHRSAGGGMFHIASLGSWSPRVLSPERFPLPTVHTDDAAHTDDASALSSSVHSFVVLGHALGDASSLLDVHFASSSIIPAFIALTYFNMTHRPFSLLHWHPPSLSNSSTPPRHSVHGRAATSSPWLAPLTPLPPLTAAQLPPNACFSHVLVGHESAFRLSPESDAVRGVALRSLRDTVLQHHNALSRPVSIVLRINFYALSSLGAGGADRIDCTSFPQLLEGLEVVALVECVDIDAMESFSHSASAIYGSHVHVISGDHPSALMLMLARDAAVVFVLHNQHSKPELVAEPMQLLGDLPWIQVTHVWESDELLRAKLHEAVEHAAIRAQLATTTLG